MSSSLVAGIQVPTVWQLPFVKVAISVVQFGKHPKLPESRTADNMWPAYPNVFTT